jgi:transposase
MQARDFRSIGRAAQDELRRRALFLIERQGLSQGEAAQLVGVHRRTVNIWVKRHRAQGEDGVLDDRRVSPRRGKGLLMAEEAGQVRTWIVD